MFTTEETALFRSLATPQKIQDFLNSLSSHPKHKRDTCWSPRFVLQRRMAHCMEGAMLAATILRFHGHRPLVLDLTAAPEDEDHVVALFKQHGHWGAISKTDYAVLRYREPIYRTIRELALSYFHEYFLQKNGRKTLRSYSRPVNLSRFDRQGWMTSEVEPWYIPEYLCEVRHHPLLSKGQIATLRCADPIEIKAGWLKEEP
jgi:hypothetical protein